MEKKKNLRQKAEEIIKSKGLSPELKKEKDLEFLLNELDVYEAELRIQNEDLKKTQLELEKRRKQYTELFEFGPLGYFVFEEEGKILNLNLTACQMFGFFKEDLLNKNFASLLPDEESGDAFYFFKKRILDSGQRQTTEVKMQKKGKGTFYALLSGTVIPGDTIMVAVADISGKRKLKKT
ncbi:MAG: PAS domain S-box protein [Actinomycetota bacterium]|nr:PAS domain S-box protein [Actinomycetota bacterium]